MSGVIAHVSQTRPEIPRLAFRPECCPDRLWEMLAEHLRGQRVGDLLVLDAHEQEGTNDEGRRELRVQVVLDAEGGAIAGASYAELRSQVLQFARSTGIKVILTHSMQTPTA